MATIAANQFRVHFFELLDQINERGEEIVITKHGVPVAKVLPVRPRKAPVLGCMRGTCQIVGDLIEPVLLPIDEWSNDPT